VSVINSAGQGGDDARRLRQGKDLILADTLIEFGLERGTFDKLHHHEVQAAVNVEVVNLYDMRMAQTSHRCCLTLKTPDKILIIGQMAVHHFDGYVSVKTRLIGFVDFGHPASTQPCDDAILT
jgi:hypothetical protein